MSEARKRRSDTAVGREPDVLIVGAGAGGLCMAIRLKQAGIPFVVLEKASRVGGTWRDNHYPGSGCDVVSQLYSFSFEPNPDWNRRFAKQDEIQAYLEGCVERYDLERHLRLSTEVSGAVFETETNCWRVTTAEGDVLRSSFLVTSTGQLNRPSVPDFDGRDDFLGTAFHSAEWDHDLDLRGKRVAVVGSGASAIQFVPEIAPQVERLTLFQRSPNWVIPKPDRAISDREKVLFRRFPFAQRLQRIWDYVTLELTFRAFLKGSRLGRSWQGQSQQSLKDAIASPSLRETLTPDYPAGCKRILLSNDWYRTIARNNVEVVDRPIKGLGRDGIKTSEGAHRADVVIYATGFETTDLLAPIKVRGLGGRDLSDVWSKGAIAHRGITVAGFPNMFMLYGPNTNLGHGSTIFMLECQVNYVMRALRKMAARKSDFMMVRDDVMRRFNRQLDRDLARTIWAGDCSSWYKNADGKIINNWSSSTLQYWWETLRVKSREYQFEPPQRPQEASVGVSG